MEGLMPLYYKIHTSSGVGSVRVRKVQGKERGRVITLVASIAPNPTIIAETTGN